MGDQQSSTMSNPDPLSDFEIITNSEVLKPSPPTTPENSPTPEHRMSDAAISENPTPENPAPENPAPETPTITTSDLEKLYKFSSSLVDQHNLALQTIRSYETEKFLTLLSIKDLVAKQDEILSLCTRLGKAHSLGEPVGIPEEGILSYMLDCIENLQRPLDFVEDKLAGVEEKIDDKMGDIEEKVDDVEVKMQAFEDHVVDHVVRVEEKLNKKPSLSESLDLSRKILNRVTVLEEALLHDIDDEFGFINHHQEGILGYLSDEIFNLVHQVDGFEGTLQEMVDGVEGSLHEFVGENLGDIGERITYLHERVDSSVQDSSKMLEMCGDIRKQLLDAEGNGKSTFLNFQEEINQRLDVLEGRVTLKSPKGTLSNVFEDVALEAKVRKQRRDLLQGRVGSLGTSKSSMDTMPPSMRDFVDETWSDADISKLRKFGILPSTTPPSSPFNFGAAAKTHTNPCKLSESPTASFRKPNKPSTSRTESTANPQNLDEPSSPNFDLFPKLNSSPFEQALPELRFPTRIVCGSSKRNRSPSPKYDNGPLTFSNTRLKPTTQKELPQFIPPSKFNPKQNPFSTMGSSSTLQIPKVDDKNETPFGDLSSAPLPRKSKNEMKKLARALGAQTATLASALNEKKPIETGMKATNPTESRPKSPTPPANTLLNSDLILSPARLGSLNEGLIWSPPTPEKKN